VLFEAHHCGYLIQIYFALKIKSTWLYSTTFIWVKRRAPTLTTFAHGLLALEKPFNRWKRNHGVMHLFSSVAISCEPKWMIELSLAKRKKQVSLSTSFFRARIQWSGGFGWFGDQHITRRNKSRWSASLTNSFPTDQEAIYCSLQATLRSAFRPWATFKKSSRSDSSCKNSTASRTCLLNHYL
jgi:hypothetical protein